MRWNRHSRLEGQHAFLGASKHSWINYDEEKLTEAYYSYLASQRGTKLHAIAAELIANRIKLPPTNATFNKYVNDAIGFRMKPEQPLYFSDNCFGTADAIAYSEDEQFLRIHDLKTGITPVADKYGNLPQLEIYAALFFLVGKHLPNPILKQHEEILSTPMGQMIRPILENMSKGGNNAFLPNMFEGNNNNNNNNQGFI